MYLSRIARMLYTCNTCGHVINDIDVTSYQWHCMLYHIFQKFELFRFNSMPSFIDSHSQMGFN